MKRQTAPKHRFKLLEFGNPRTGSTSWRVSGIKRDGERVRQNFADPEEAKNRHLELEMEYQARDSEVLLRSTRLTEKQVGIAEAAFKLVDEDAQLLTAVRYWHAHGKHQAPGESPRLDDAFEQFKTAEESDASLRPITRMANRLRASAFINATANVRVNEVTPELIEKFLDGIKNPRTRVNYKGGVSKFMAWCIERPRRWLAVNPCTAIKIRMGDPVKPKVLSIEDCERIVRAAETFKGGRLMPYVAVAMFDGLRPFEARRIKWDQINFDDGEISIEASQSKIKRSRTFKMDEATVAWLSACKGREFFPGNFQNDWPRLLRTVGFGAGDGLKPWDKDVLRHTAISHYFRKTGSYGFAAERFGNSEPVIKRNYLNRFTTDQTARFYALRPSKISTSAKLPGQAGAGRQKPKPASGARTPAPATRKTKA